jgi:hypothetical protein
MEGTREAAAIVAAKFFTPTHWATSTKFSVHVPKAPPAAADARGTVQTQEGTFTPALIDMDDYGDPDDHDGYDVLDNPIPAH